MSQRRRWHPTPALLPGKSHGWRSLVGCSPWGREESDMTERLPFHFSLSCIGEGNGNPLQCSCLENPGDRGRLLAAVYGVIQSRTWLKWFSSSSTFWIKIDITFSLRNKHRNLWYSLCSSTCIIMWTDMNMSHCFPESKSDSLLPFSVSQVVPDINKLFMNKFSQYFDINYVNT